MSDDNPDTLPLPEGWIRTFSKSQKRYYYSHKDTKHTQWHFPTASEATDPWLAARRVKEKQEQQQRNKRPPSTTASSNTTSSGSKRPRTNESATSTSSSTPVASATTTTTTTADSKLLELLVDATNVAIIVPFRDLHVEQKRSQHLKQFIPHMIQFLGQLQAQQKVSNYHIYIVEQSDDQRKFNRGKLLNIGFDYARKHPPTSKNGQKSPHDVFIFHDVDLLPQAPLKEAYAHFPKTPYHIARVWDRYSNNPKYFGGVVSFSASDFMRINGYPNTFWGWGGEDDELQLRCQAIGLTWDYPRGLPAGSLVDLEDMNLQEKLQFLREHKEWKCMVKWEALDEHKTTWKTNGLADLQYNTLKVTSLDERTHKASKVTVDVMLNGNHWANDKCGVEFMGDWNKK